MRIESVYFGGKRCTQCRSVKAKDELKVERNELELVDWDTGIK